MEKILKNIVGLLTVCFMLSLSLFFKAEAAVLEALLSSIEIAPVNGSYEITINTNKAVPIKTHILSNRKMHIDLKNITPSKSINTVYKNATNIDHVFIQPMGRDVRIILKGENVGSSQVLLNANKIPLNFLSPKNEKKTLVLNKSINSYKPLVQDEEDPLLMDSEAEAPKGIIIPTSFDLSNVLTPSNTGWLMGLCFMFLFLFKSLKESKEKQKQTANMSLRTTPEELAQRQRDLDLHKELSKAHSRFNESLIRKQGIPPQNAFNQSVGIKEYQNSQTNPFKKVSKKPLNQNHQQSSPLQEALIKAQNKKNQQKPSNVNLASEIPTKNNLKKSQVRLNNMKFLENMKNIYEKNGRIDLANTIQEQMKNKR